MFDQERHEEINDGLIEGEDLEQLNKIDEVISAEEEEFLNNNPEETGELN